MFRFIWRNKKWAGYALYCIALTGGLLYYRFPTDILRDYLQAIPARMDSRLVLSIDGIRPWLPFGLRFSQTELSLKNRPGSALFRAEGIFLRPDAWSILKGKPELHFDCTAYKGALKGHINAKENGAKGAFDTVTELQDIHIADYKPLQDLMGRHVEGTLGGTITYDGHYNLLMDGTMEADLKVTEGLLEYLNIHPLLNFESIEFKEMEIAMVFKKGTINLSRLELKGEQFQGSLSGNITLKGGFSKSVFDLKGSIKPSPAFLKSVAGVAGTMKFIKQRMKKGTLSFAIHGTLGEPQIKFM